MTQLGIDWTARECRREARESLSPRTLNDQHRRILSALAEAGSRGLSDEEGIEVTGLSPSSYRPRRGELEERGAVKASGAKRPGRSGRLATVWILTGQVLP
jgi:hypothetical protein